MVDGGYMFEIGFWVTLIKQVNIKYQYTIRHLGTKVNQNTNRTKRYMLIALAAIFIVALPSISAAPSSDATTQTSALINTSGIVTPFAQPYSYLIGIFSNNTYYCVNGTSDQYITALSSTNAARIINNVIAIATSGNTILLSAGIYTINSSIVSHGKNNISLMGEHGTILQYASDFASAIIYLTAASNWVISGLTLDGSLSQATPSFQSVWQVGIRLQDCVNVEVENNYINEFRVYGIWTLSSYPTITSYGGSIHNNVITNCGWNGITIGGSLGETSGIRVYSNDVSGSSDVGITIYGEDNMIYENNVSSCLSIYGQGSANSGNGIDVEEGTDNVISNNVVTNCNASYCAWYEGLPDPVSFNTFANDSSINSTSDKAAFILNAPNNYIQGGTVVNWNTRAVWIANASNCVVQNLEITKTIHTAGWNVGIGLDWQSSNNVTLSNNRIIDQTGTVITGIEDYMGTSLSIQGNTIVGVQTGITINCNNTIVQNNVISSCTTTNGIIVETGTYYCLVQSNTLVLDHIVDNGIGTILIDNSF